MISVIINAKIIVNAHHTTPLKCIYVYAIYPPSMHASPKGSMNAINKIHIKIIIPATNVIASLNILSPYPNITSKSSSSCFDTLFIKSTSC